MAENICGGFRKAGVYPFTRNAILLFHSELLDKQLPASTSTSAGTSSTVSALPPARISSRSVTSPTTLSSISPSFSKEQEDCYKQRYSKGYDLMNPEYLRWLEIYHPEAIPADRYSLVTAPSSTPIQASSSVVDHFSSVSPVQGANVTGSSTATDTSSSSYIAKKAMK